jgi:hypothetical protein
MLEIKAKLAQNKGFHLTYRIIRKDGEIIWVEEFADVILKMDKLPISRV